MIYLLLQLERIYFFQGYCNHIDSQNKKVFFLLVASSKQLFNHSCQLFKTKIQDRKPHPQTTPLLLNYFYRCKKGNKLVSRILTE